MPWEVRSDSEITIEIKELPHPGVLDYLFGTLWMWALLERPRGVKGVRLTVTSGFGRTEAAVRRRASKAYRRQKSRTARGQAAVRYEYNPAGLPDGEPGK